MSEKQLEIVKDLYRIPWTAYNNANGWIEPTTHCQLKCPGCFRGLCENNHKPEHFSLEELKAQVDFLIEKRKVQNISIGGGEPLLYPHLGELITYINSKDTNTMLFTNGILLDEEKLKSLKKHGLNKVSIHIDKFQQRKDVKDEKVANKIRAEYCDLFRRVSGIKLGFIMSISTQNMDDLDILAPFFIENADIVDLVTFTVYKEMLPGKSINPELTYSYEDLINKIKETFELKFCAYIGKILTDEIAWMYATTLYRNGKSRGEFTPEAFKNIQESHLKEHGRYLFEPVDQWSQKLSEKKIYRQSVILINGPDLTPEGWDLCDGCPDSMYVDGKLIPSCLWERVKNGEDIQTK